MRATDTLPPRAPGGDRARAFARPSHGAYDCVVRSRIDLVRAFALTTLVGGCAPVRGSVESEATTEVNVTFAAGGEQIPDVPAVRRASTEALPALDDDAAALRAGRTVSLGSSWDGEAHGHASPQQSVTYASGARPAAAGGPSGRGLWGDSVRVMPVRGRGYPADRGEFQLPAPPGAPR